MLKWNNLICIPVALMVLIAATVAPALASTPSVASGAGNGQVILATSPEYKTIEQTNTSTIVKVGNILISEKSDADHTWAVMDIKDLNTGEKKTVNYNITRSGNQFITKMYVDKKLVATSATDYDPLAPGSAGHMLKSAKSSSATLSAAASSYSYDGVRFVNGKYSHPDYAYYQGTTWSNWYINGNQLVHYHVGADFSRWIVSLAAIPAGAAFGAFVGASIGGPYGAAAGAAIGTTLGICISLFGYYFLTDEYGCIWYWYSYAFALLLLTGKLVTAPLYVRVGSVDLWNFMGMPSP